jgi:hypothetical protein
MIASNMSESDESGNDVDDDEEVIVPRPIFILSGIVPISSNLLWRKMKLLKTGGDAVGV